MLNKDICKKCHEKLNEEYKDVIQKNNLPKIIWTYDGWWEIGIAVCVGENVREKITYTQSEAHSKKHWNSALIILNT